MSALKVKHAASRNNNWYKTAMLAESQEESLAWNRSFAKGQNWVSNHAILCLYFMMLQKNVHFLKTVSQPAIRESALRMQECQDELFCSKERAYQGFLETSMIFHGKLARHELNARCTMS